MKYAVEVASCAMIYIQNFVKIVSAVLEFIGRGYTDTQRAW
jgi:hypothetical protein